MARESVHQVMESVGLGLEKGQTGEGGCTLRTLPVAAAAGVGLVAKGDSESKGAMHHLRNGPRGRPPQKVAREEAERPRVDGAF